MKSIANKPPAGVFVTGTDTEIGKTFLSCWELTRLRAKGIRVGAYKPVASGSESIDTSDAYRLWQASGTQLSIERVNPQSFIAPLAPPIAAELENRMVDEDRIIDGVEAWANNCDFLLIEGAGGLLSPISWNSTNADLAETIGYPLWVVAPNRLGVVHHILSTITVAISRGLHVQTLYLNNMEAQSTHLAASSNARLLAPFLERLSPHTKIESIPFIHLERE
jgi:dethiobiotin synthetase